MFKKSSTKFVNKYPNEKLKTMTRTLASITFPDLIMPLKFTPDNPKALTNVKKI